MASGVSIQGDGVRAGNASVIIGGDFTQIHASHQATLEQLEVALSRNREERRDIEREIIDLSRGGQDISSAQMQNAVKNLRETRVCIGELVYGVKIRGGRARSTIEEDSAIEQWVDALIAQGKREKEEENQKEANRIALAFILFVASMLILQFLSLVWQ